MDDERENALIHALPYHQHHHRENDPSKEVTERWPRYTTHEQPAREHSQKRCGKQSPEILPGYMPVIAPDSHQVGRNKHRHDGSCRLLCRHDQSHEEDGNESESAEARLGEPDTKGCNGGQKPGKRIQRLKRGETHSLFGSSSGFSALRRAERWDSRSGASWLCSSRTFWTRAFTLSATWLDAWDFMMRAILLPGMTKLL